MFLTFRPYAGYADAMDTDSSLRENVAVVVPCYNAGERVRPVLEKLQGIVDHVLVMDDGSTDALAERIRDLSVQYVSFSQNRGKGFVLLDGFRLARQIPGVTCIATLDSDGQHDPAELPGLYDTFCRQQADLVIGSRTFGMQHVPLRSRIGNKLTITVTGLLLGKRLPDTQSGYRLHSARFVDHLLETMQGGRYETEMEILVRGVRKGFCVVPSPIQTIYEEGNRSSHFNVWRDCGRIYWTLLRTSLRI